MYHTSTKAGSRGRAPGRARGLGGRAPFFENVGYFEKQSEQSNHDLNNGLKNMDPASVII